MHIIYKLPIRQIKIMQDTQSLQQSARRKFIQINGRRSSNKRKTIEEPQIFEEIIDKIDVILNKDYKQWNNQPENFNIMKCQTAQNTSLLRKYIKCIYTRYKLQDPLDPKNNFQNIQSAKSGRKILNLFQIKENKKTQYQTPQKESSRIKQNFSNIKFVINSAQSTKPYFHQLHNSRANTSYTARQTVRLNQSADKPFGQNNNNTFRYENLPSARILQSQITNLHFPHREFVKESYRYCIGCQTAILENNIEIHQKSCVKFQEILNKNPEQILQVIQCKVIQIATRIEKNQNLQNKDADEMRNISQNLLSLARKCISLGKNSKRDKQFLNNYDKSMIIGKKWCDTIQQINKLNWFLRMRQQLYKEVLKK